MSRLSGELPSPLIAQPDLVRTDPYSMKRAEESKVDLEGAEWTLCFVLGTFFGLTAGLLFPAIAVATIIMAPLRVGHWPWNGDAKLWYGIRAVMIIGLVVGVVSGLAGVSGLGAINW